MNSPSWLASLRRELASLRRELASLRRMLLVARDAQGLDSRRWWLVTRKASTLVEGGSWRARSRSSSWTHKGFVTRELAGLSTAAEKSQRFLGQIFHCRFLFLFLLTDFLFTVFCNVFQNFFFVHFFLFSLTKNYWCSFPFLDLCFRFFFKVSFFIFL